MEAGRIFDALDGEIVASSDRRSLQTGTKENLRRYKDAGIKVAPGAPPGGTMRAGGALVVGGAGAVSRRAILVGKGVNRTIQNNRIQDELTARAWTTDTVPAAGGIEGSVFVPIAPGPRKLVVHYCEVSATTHAVAMLAVHRQIDGRCHSFFSPEFNNLNANSTCTLARLVATPA